MKALTVLAVLLLAGCGLTPAQKAVLIGIGATSLALSLNDKDGRTPERHIPTPGVSCSGTVCQ